MSPALVIVKRLPLQLAQSHKLTETAQRSSACF